MSEHRHFIRGTVSMAVLAACFIASNVQAGPLGAGGSIGGGLNGSLAPRQLDAAGQAGAHVQRDGALPRGDRMRGTAGAATSAAATKTGEAKDHATDKAVEAKAGATATGSAAKGAALDKAAEAKAAAQSPTAISGAARAGGSAVGTDASAGGSVQASREHGAADTRMSAQGSVRR